jgi:phosphonate transport system permease protein
MENKEYTPQEVKVPLFDRIFKPQVITLENGHSTVRPRSRLPLIAACVLVVFVWAIKMTGFDLSIIATRGNELFNILGKIFQPKWSFFPKVVSPLIDTIKMSIMGTVIGCVLALPFAVLASSNINHKKWIVSIVRFILALIRTLPTLIIALACALIFSLGTFAGTVAIAIFTFGIVAKMLYESIETIDMGPFEAMEALGADKFQAFWSACVPQILPVYLSHCLYCFEMNVRASAILGYVGAGGLGITINERIGWRDYNGLGMVLLTLFVVVLAIEFFSEYLRKKLS